MNDPLRPLRSSVGSKYTVALTGLALIGFVLIHMAGNLTIFAGQDAMNSYAQKLKQMGPLLWVARAGLLAVFVLHVVVALRLNWANREARPVRYAYEDTLRASWASRHMVLTGLVLLAFILYHLAHFTWGLTHQADTQIMPGRGAIEAKSPDFPKNYLDLAERRSPNGKGYAPEPWVNLRDKEKEQDPDYRHDVYSMVVAGFRVWWISALYIVSMVFLALHLWHGGSSLFQSLGVNAHTWQRVVSYAGPVTAVVILVGNCSIPVAVLLGLVR